MVSDATVHPNGISMSAWTIWEKAEVWSGKGYALEPSMEMYSGL